MVKDHMKYHDSDSENYELVENKGELRVLNNEKQDITNKKTNTKLIESIHLKKKSPRKKPVYWTEEEISYLIKGVDELGYGKWKQMLEIYGKHFAETRRPLDLKDKYRLMNKVSSYHTVKTKRYVETSISNLGEPVSNPIIINEKYPYDAAVRIAKKIRIGKTKEVRICVMDMDEKKKVHIYIATKIDDVLHLRKEQSINIDFN
ncbi:Myb-like DNA-binding domain containing protein [Spraguea lophii 42_110]|uniref:Myb-like DNA-binding domain containing protein n=1 Tax=Spraguea lophii (strain 42_110) TaxID=1358809 RepID=S7XL77_SPRLO|nr:Myb-like DNA-binding domain containing protein [Spraguea lophii 42_110]